MEGTRSVERAPQGSEMQSWARRWGTLDRALQLPTVGVQERAGQRTERRGVMWEGSQDSSVLGRSREFQDVGWERPQGGLGSRERSLECWKLASLPPPSAPPPPPPPRPLPLRLRLREITSPLRGSRPPTRGAPSPRLYRHIYCNNKVRRGVGGGGRRSRGDRAGSRKQGNKIK